MEKMSTKNKQQQIQQALHAATPAAATASSKQQPMLPSSMSISPSSPRSSADSYGTDDGSIIHDSSSNNPGRHHNKSPLNNITNHNNNNNNGGSKSPILIKYNYFDYNGHRQDNSELLLLTANNNNSRSPRQISPTFKQNLNQILVRTMPNNEQPLHQHDTSNNIYFQPILSPKSSPMFAGEHLHSAALVRTARQSSASPQQSVASPGPAQVLHFPSSSGGGGATMTLLARRYNRSSYEHRCLRCKKTVYQMDKVGPLKDFSFYHQNCFKCFECGTKLTLKTYFNNQHSSVDLEVYCHRHCPKTPAGKLDNQSVGIRAALNAPKVFEPILNLAHLHNLSTAPFYDDQDEHQHLSQHNHHHHHNYNHDGTIIFDSTNNHRSSPSNGNNNNFNDLHIQHAIKQTKLQAIYKQSQVDKKISQFLNRRLEYLEPKQKLLEMRHREEEEQLFKAFELKWRQEEKQIRDQIRDEWQLELNKLLEKYKRQLLLNETNNNCNSNGLGQGHNSHKKLNNNQIVGCLGQQQDEQNKQQVAANIAAAAAAAVKAAKQQQQQHSVMVQTTSPNYLKSSASQTRPLPQHQHQQQVVLHSSKASGVEANEEEQQMIEVERMNLEKTMTIKLDKKKETLKRKLKEFERQATAELVEKQSHEMLALISMKLEEFKEEQKRKIGSDLEQFEALESLANQLGDSLQISSTKLSQQQQQLQQQLACLPASLQVNANKASTTQSKLGAGVASVPKAPSPCAPKVSKWQLYNCEQADEVFREIDSRAINIAQEDQQSFTDLVHHLTRHCLTDIEKVRAIFRWITVKNLNTMQFDSSIKPDTPFGLLRGIKQGSESYHVLFKRLCSYAGLHCVVIKGYSKSAGYQPGVQFEGNRFRNSWNAVYVAGAWRFVQCNWGARHLVSVAVMQDKNSSSSSPNIGHSAANGSKPNLGRRGSQQQIINQTPQVSTTGHSAVSSDKSTSRKHNSSSNGTTTTTTRHDSPVFSSTGTSISPTLSATSMSSSSQHHHRRSSSSSSKQQQQQHKHQQTLMAPKEQQVAEPNGNGTASGIGHAAATAQLANNTDSLRYEYDDHYFLTDPDEFIYEFFPLDSQWQLLTKSQRPITLNEFEQLPFVRSLFFKYGLYFPQPDIRSVLHTDSSGAITIKIGMPTHMIPNLIFHYNLKYFNSDQEQYDGISLKRFVMQSVEACANPVLQVQSGSIQSCNNNNSSITTSGNNNNCSNSPNGSAYDQQQQQQASILSNIVSFRVHVPENGAYILDIFANSTTPTQYITGEPMKFKSVCKFKIVAKNLRTCMIPLPDCASGEYGPMKATRLFGIIPLTHENGLISMLINNNSNSSSSSKSNGNNNNYNIESDSNNSTSSGKRTLEIQFRMTRPLLDFMASLHKNGSDERQLSKWIKIYIDGDIVFIVIKFQEDGQYGLDIYTRDQYQLAAQQQQQQQQQLHRENAKLSSKNGSQAALAAEQVPKKQLLTHCCKYLINVRTLTPSSSNRL